MQSDEGAGPVGRGFGRAAGRGGRRGFAPRASRPRGSGRGEPVFRIDAQERPMEDLRFRLRRRQALASQERSCALGSNQAARQLSILASKIVTALAKKLLPSLHIRSAAAVGRAAVVTNRRVGQQQPRVCSVECGVEGRAARGRAGATGAPQWRPLSGNQASHQLRDSRAAAAITVPVCAPTAPKSQANTAACSCRRQSEAWLCSMRCGRAGGYSVARALGELCPRTAGRP